jgi:protein SCO1/2
MTPLQSHSRLLAATALFIAVGSMATLAGCGGGGGSTTQTSQQGVPKGQTAVKGGANFAGIEATPAKASPPLKLRDSLGKQVELAQYRGKAVLLTFIYTHCPDVCPLIVANLHNALALLGRRASDVRIVAVSADPKGDTSKAIASFLAQRDMTGRLEYLVGSRATLVRVWRAWGIKVSNPTNHDGVAHSSLVYGITASGKVTTVYPSNFTPAGLAHDVPLLAAN